MPRKIDILRPTKGNHWDQVRKRRATKNEPNAAGNK
jgi:hypothetical protein